MRIWSDTAVVCFGRMISHTIVFNLNKLFMDTSYMMYWYCSYFYRKGHTNESWALRMRFMRQCGFKKVPLTSSGSQHRPKLGRGRAQELSPLLLPIRVSTFILEWWIWIYSCLNVKIKVLTALNV